MHSTVLRRVCCGALPLLAACGGGRVATPSAATQPADARTVRPPPAPRHAPAHAVLPMWVPALGAELWHVGRDGDGQLALAGADHNLRLRLGDAQRLPTAVTTQLPSAATEPAEAQSPEALAGLEPGSWLLWRDGQAWSLPSWFGAPQRLHFGTEQRGRGAQLWLSPHNLQYAPSSSEPATALFARGDGPGDWPPCAWVGAIARRDAEHALALCEPEGMRLTRDGGRSWTAPRAGAQPLGWIDAATAREDGYVIWPADRAQPPHWLSADGARMQPLAGVSDGRAASPSGSAYALPRGRFDDDRWQEWLRRGVWWRPGQSLLAVIDEGLWQLDAASGALQRLARVPYQDCAPLRWPDASPGFHCHAGGDTVLLRVEDPAAAVPWRTHWRGAGLRPVRAAPEGGVAIGGGCAERAEVGAHCTFDRALQAHTVRLDEIAGSWLAPAADGNLAQLDPQRGKLRRVAPGTPPHELALSGWETLRRDDPALPRQTFLVRGFSAREGGGYQLWLSQGERARGAIVREDGELVAQPILAQQGVLHPFHTRALLVSSQGLICESLDGGAHCHAATAHAKLVAPKRDGAATPWRGCTEVGCLLPHGSRIGWSLESPPQAATPGEATSPLAARGAPLDGDPLQRLRREGKRLRCEVQGVVRPPDTPATLPIGPDPSVRLIAQGPLERPMRVWWWDPAAASAFGSAPFVWSPLDDALAPLAGVPGAPPEALAARGSSTSRGACTVHPAAAAGRALLVCRESQGYRSSGHDVAWYALRAGEPPRALPPPRPSAAAGRFVAMHWSDEEPSAVLVADAQDALQLFERHRGQWQPQRQWSLGPLTRRASSRLGSAQLPFALLRPGLGRDLHRGSLSLALHNPAQGSLHLYPTGAHDDAQVAWPASPLEACTDADTGTLVRSHSLSQPSFFLDLVHDGPRVCVQRAMLAWRPSELGPLRGDAPSFPVVLWSANQPHRGRCQIDAAAAR